MTTNYLAHWGISDVFDEAKVARDAGGRFASKALDAAEVAAQEAEKLANAAAEMGMNVEDYIAGLASGVISPVTNYINAQQAAADKVAYDATQIARNANLIDRDLNKMINSWAPDGGVQGPGIGSQEFRDLPDLDVPTKRSYSQRTVDDPDLNDSKSFFGKILDSVFESTRTVSTPTGRNGDIVEVDRTIYHDALDLGMAFADFVKRGDVRHYGVKGMKWGVRRTDAQLKAAGSKTETTAVKKPDGPESSQQRYARLTAQAKAEGGGKMSDEDLKFFNARTEAIAKVNKLMVQPKEGWLGKTTKTVLQNTAQQSMQAITGAVANKYITVPVTAALVGKAAEAAAKK